MTSPIKAGDIVRVTDIDPVEQIDGSHLYECEPLTHSTLTDIDAASVMLERAHHRIGELTRELADDLKCIGAEADALLTHQLGLVRGERDAMVVERDHEIDLRKAAERALAEAQRFMTEAIRERNDLLSPKPCLTESARANARRRVPLDGADAQALEHALTVTERERDAARSNINHLSSENASLVIHVESMAMRIESLAGELAKPEDVRLREVLDALDGRAVIFDGLGARVGHLLDEMDEWIERAGATERRLEKALAEAQRELPTLPRSPCCNAAVRCGRCGDEFARREPTTHEKMLQPIGASQPNGYDPGARPAQEKAADPHAWGREGLWTMPKDGSQYPVRLTFPRNASGSWWRGVDTDGGGTNAVLELRRSATPEETARFEAELARNAAPFVSAHLGVFPGHPGGVGLIKTLDGPPDPTPLAVGQRWQWRDRDETWDSTIVAIEGDAVVATSAGCDETDRWSALVFRHNHPRLRLPEELEPKLRQGEP